MVNRKLSSCSQYQSEESSVRLRKRASLSRSTSSASLRCRNWPIWAPITWIACRRDRKSTRLNSSHLGISYAVFCLKKKKKQRDIDGTRAPSLPLFVALPTTTKKNGCG